MSAYCLKLSESMPVALVLGFFVQIVVDRWVAQLWLLPWPDRLAMMLSAHVTGDTERSETDGGPVDSTPHAGLAPANRTQPPDSVSLNSSVSNVNNTTSAVPATPSGAKKGVETGYIHELQEQRSKEPPQVHEEKGDKGSSPALGPGISVPEDQSRLIRRTVVRYVLLAFAMVLCSISTQVKKRFPTDEHLVNAGLMRPDELETMNKRFGPTFGARPWIPITWATNLVARARRQGRIRSDIALRVMNEFINFRCIL